jgi:predicted hydrolase (HD superfamily)
MKTKSGHYSMIKIEAMLKKINKELNEDEISHLLDGLLNKKRLLYKTFKRITKWI